jgi:hypothetical protein
MGHALRLMVGREQALDGVIEIDSLYVGGKPRRLARPGRQSSTTCLRPRLIGFLQKLLTLRLT